MPAPKCAVHVLFTIKSDCINQFHEAVLLQAKNSLEKEPWCVQFDVCTMPQRPDCVMLYETYDDRAAFEKHRETQHLADFNATIADWVVDREVTIWDIAPGS